MPAEPRDRLIVALDCPTLEESLLLVERLGETASFYKVGWRLFLQGGLDLVRRLRGEGKRAFLDLKIGDIPETVATALGEMKGEADFVTIQGTAAAASAAKQGLIGAPSPKTLFVTLLSSVGPDELRSELNYSGPLTPDELLSDYILRRGREAIANGADGLIASGESVAMLRKEFPTAILVTPGIRPAGSSTDDHQRLLTPAKAIRSGSDYLVVGRPIWAAADPIEAANRIVEEIASASP